MDRKCVFAVHVAESSIQVILPPQRPSAGATATEGMMQSKGSPLSVGNAPSEHVPVVPVVVHAAVQLMAHDNEPVSMRIGHRRHERTIAGIVHVQSGMDTMSEPAIK
jgi:hypothetical protein